MDTIYSAVTIYHASAPCLLGAWQGVCNYYSGQPVSFSLGEAIASFGLIFAVYQLKKPSWDIRLQIQGWRGNLLWIFGGLGLFFILLSVVISNIPIGLIRAPWGISLFYELLGFFCFIASPVSLFIFGSVKVEIFNSRNAERFYEVLHYNVMRLERERLEATVDILRQNLPPLIKALLQNDNELIDKSNQQKKRFAYLVFTILLSEKRVVDYIVTERMDFVGTMFNHLKKHKEYTLDVKNGVGKIFERLFQNENSFLYNQLTSEGLTLSVNLYEHIFSDYDVVKKYKPFSQGIKQRLAGSYDSVPVTVYLRAFELSLEAYFSEQRTCIDNNQLIKAFNALDRYMENICSMIASKALPYKEVYSDISTIGHFYGHTFPILFKKARTDGVLYAIETKDNLSRTDSPENLSEAYVSSLYAYTKSLSTFIPNKNDAWSITFQIQNAYWDFSSNDLEKIRDRLLELIWEQVQENINGYFPAVMRNYLTILPWWDTTVRTDWYGLEREKMRKILIQLKPRFINKDRMRNNVTLMSDELLPHEIKFSETENKIYYITNLNTRIDIA